MMGIRLGDSIKMRPNCRAGRVLVENPKRIRSAFDAELDGLDVTEWLLAPLDPTPF